MTMILEVEGLNNKVLITTRIKDVQFIEIHQKVIKLNCSNDLCIIVQPGDKVSIIDAEPRATRLWTHKVIGTGEDKLSFKALKDLLITYM